MTPRRKITAQKRKHVTAHRRASASQAVAALIVQLRRSWKALDRVERGDRLCELAKLGCSTRGLGEELGLSATTIRRHIDLASMPESAREAVKAGASSKKILAAKAANVRRQKKQKRVTDEQRTGALSDEIADIILWFCSGKGRPARTRILIGDLPEFLNSLRVYLSREMQREQPIKATKRLGPAGLVTAAKPSGDPASEGTLWMDYFAEWLAGSSGQRRRSR